MRRIGLGVRETSPPCDFRDMMHRAIALVAVLLVLPFAVSHLAEGRLVLGVGLVAVVAVLVLNGWPGRKGRLLPIVVFVCLVPTILFAQHMAIVQLGLVGALWTFAALTMFYMVLPERQAWLVNVLLLGLVFAHAWSGFEPQTATRLSATLITVSILTVIFVRIINLQQAKLQLLAETDPLTGLCNRVRLDSTLDDSVRRFRRSGRPDTLVVLDIDHFKRINDNHGHDAGDHVIRSIGGMLLGRIRGSDKAFRLGGEEFLVLLYQTDAEGGRAFAEDLRRHVEAADILSGASITASIGIATTRRDEDWRSWLKRCDDNLYAAKSGGRNLVCGAEPAEAFA